jgi:hypothetical protein
VHEQAATQVFERDCLIRLGAVVAPIGSGKPGQPCLRVEIPGGEKRSVPFGELLLMPIPSSGTFKLRLAPERGFDLGDGKGREVETALHGGVVGLIVDTRGRRPFALPAEAGARIERLRAWNSALGLYPREV